MTTKKQKQLEWVNANKPNVLKERFENHKNFRPRKKDIQLHTKCHAGIDENGNLYIDSYFSGWKILRNIDGLYVFNWYNYSNTTRRHQYSASTLVKEFGIDCITFDSNDGLRYGVNLQTILISKIDELYRGENDLSLSRATKYAVFSEHSYNELMKDIQTIAKHTKMKNAQLDRLLIEAEDKATSEMFQKLFNDSERRDSLKVARAMQNNFEAVAV